MSNTKYEVNLNLIPFLYYEYVMNILKNVRRNQDSHPIPPVFVHIVIGPFLLTFMTFFYFALMYNFTLILLFTSTPYTFYSLLSGSTTWAWGCPDDIPVVLWTPMSAAGFSAGCKDDYDAWYAFNWFVWTVYYTVGLEWQDLSASLIFNDLLGLNTWVAVCEGLV